MPDFAKILQAKIATFKLATSRYQSGAAYFNKYSPIYIASTSNVKSTLNLYDNYETVLCLGSTGAHAYEAALHGAKEVDMFDINLLQFFYYLFMQTAIINLSYEDFIKYFTLKDNQRNYYTKEDVKDLLSNDLYSKLAFLLPEEVSLIFEELYESIPSYYLIFSSLFRFEHNLGREYLKSNISFYNKDEYNKLQTILRENKCKFNYYQCGIEDVPKKFAGQKYDLILLDNLFQYYKSMKGFDTPYKVNEFITQRLSELLKENGKIQAAYGFEVATDALKITLNIPFEAQRKIIAFLNYDLIEQDTKEGICSNLIKKWPTNYAFDFIRGVENRNGNNSSNVILTYSKKK